MEQCGDVISDYFIWLLSIGRNSREQYSLHRSQPTSQRIRPPFKRSWAMESPYSRTMVDSFRLSVCADTIVVRGHALEVVPI